MLIFFLLATVGFLVVYIFFAYMRIQNTQSSLRASLLEKNERLDKLVTDKSQLDEQVKNLASNLKSSTEDSVTKILGWPLFEDRLHLAVKESERYQFNLGILFIDIDNFKMINNALSYETGNAVLQELAKRLQTCIRQVDSLSRFSKDRFVILLSRLNKPETAVIVAQRIFQTLKEPFSITDHEFFITVGIGIAIYPHDGSNVEALLRSAEQALLLAKKNGRNVYQFYKEELHSQSQRELAINTNLAKENVFEEFFLYYQPIMNVNTETIFAMDALLNWQHPQQGLIDATELYAYAFRQKKQNYITEWVIKTACRQILHWRSLGFAPVCVGIPLFLQQLENIHFIYRINQILQELNFNPAWLMLEIRKGQEHISDEALYKAFNMLSYIGVKIAIDNFGNDTLALVHLKKLPIHYLKMTPDLISDLVDNPSTEALIKSVIFLAQNLSKEIIFQGVELESQIEILKSLGCYLMEGKLLGLPLTESEVQEKMI